MKMFLKMMLVMSGFVLVGCGGGSSESGVDTTVSLSSDYVGEEKQVVLTEENSQKFTQGIHYLENLDVIDLPNGSESDMLTGISVDNYINQSTGLGYSTTYYDNYQHKVDRRIDGQIRADILNIEETIDSFIVTSRVSYDIKVLTSDNNLTFKILVNFTFKVSEVGEELLSMVVSKYHIYNQKNNEIIEFTELSSDGIGKIYVSSEGYVNFTSTDSEYVLKGLDTTSLTLLFKDEDPIYETIYRDPADPINGQPEPYEEEIYSPKEGHGVIEIVLNNSKKPDLYFVQDHVTQFEPPKFYENRGEANLLEYAFFSWHTHYKLLNEDVNNIDISIEWFVNNVKVDAPVMYELPLGSFTEGDTVKVVVTATHGDITIKREHLLEDYDANYNVSSGAYEYPEDTFDIEYRTNSLEFNLDLLTHEYFKNIDMGKSEVSWYTTSLREDSSQLLEVDGEIVDESHFDYRIINNTEYQKTPTILAKRYGSLYEPMYLKIYTEHEFKVVRFNIVLERGTSGIGSGIQEDIIESIEEANIIDNTRYISTNSVKLMDVDRNGLDDIIYTSSTYDGGFLNISYQERQKDFRLEKLKVNGGLYIADFHGNGDKQALMFGSDENHSALISLEKGNMHIVKDINISNYHNILNLQAISDMNNDGKDDLIISNNQEDKLYIYENIDDLSQKRLVGSSECRAIQEIRDINRDGLNDIICIPEDNNEYNTTTGTWNSELEIKYFIQNSNQNFELKTRTHSLGSSSGINVFGAVMLDESHIAASVQDINGYALYTCDLNSDSSEPQSKTGTNSYSIDAFFLPTDINNDGMVDLISGQGSLNIFYQNENFVFDSDYSVALNSSYPLIESRFLRNAFLDDIDNDGSLEIVTVNGENKFSYINLK